MEALPADDQRPFEDLIMRDEKEVMRQWNEQRDKEEAELLHKLSERRKEAAEKYLSHFTVDRHQKIIRQGEIDMESLLPPLQGPAVSTPDLSLTIFMDQRGDQLKQYVDESIKMNLRAYEKSAAPSFPSRESNTEPPASNTSAINGSPLTQPSYGVPMHTFVSPSQPQPLGTRQVLDATEPFGVFCWTVRPDAGPHTKHSGRTVHGRTTRVQPRTIRPHHGLSGASRRTVRICCGPSAILHRTVRIWHEPTDILRRTIRLYTSPRADCLSRAIYDRSIRIQPWTIRPDRGPSSSLRQTVWVRDYPRSTIYGWTIRIYLQTFGQVANHPASYVGPSGYAYAEPRAAQYAQFPHSPQQHYGAPPATHYNHAIPPHGYRAEYYSAIREPERYRAGDGDINRTPNTHLKHPWEESRQSDVRQPEISTHKLNGWSPDMAERVRDEVAGMFRDKLGVSVSGTGQSYLKGN
jgi:hypothetical protein